MVNLKKDKKLLDIVLLSPINKKLGYFKPFVPRSIPVGVAILYSYLSKYGYEVEVIDGDIVNINKKFLFKKMRMMKKTKIFGISAMTTNIEDAYKIAKQIKNIDKNAVIIFGGIHPTAMLDEVLSKTYIDFVVIGEGERTLLILLKKIKTGDSNFREINSLAYKNKYGEIIRNERYQDIFDIDGLPLFPYYIFNKKDYDLGFILSSRGCPFNCIFCSQRLITNGMYRSYAIKKIVKEMDYLINKMGQRNITFFDDYFLGDKKRISRLCKIIRKKGFHNKCSFGIQTRGDSVSNELLLEMKESGFNSVMIGFETSSNNLMKFINKSETVEDNIRAVKLVKKVGMVVEATFIFGFCGERYEDRINSLCIAKKLIGRARFNNIIPYPGTKLYDIILLENKLNIVGEWNNFSSAGAASGSVFKKYCPPYYPDKTKPNDLVGEVFLANLLFYFNLSNVKKLFNIGKGGSGKWFEIPKSRLLNPIIWFYICLLTVNIFLRTVYFLIVSRECRKFFIEGLFKFIPIDE